MSGGSRRRFVHPSLPTISLHQPHPGNTLKAYQVDQLVEALRKEGLL
ncbi:MAG: type II toxin-antitoxin system HicA family toxin [Acidobacteriota bacterium]